MLLGNGDGTFGERNEFASGKYPQALAMGDFVNDPTRLNGRRPGWNDQADYGPVVGEEFDAGVERFGPGPGRAKMAKNTLVDFTRGLGKRVDYPILSFAGTSDYIVIPEFQKVFADSAALGGKDHAMIWGSAPGHCAFTPFELRAVVLEYLEWLDSYGGPAPDEPSTEDVLARCLSLPEATSGDCNFDPEFSAPALADRFPPRAEVWPASRSRNRPCCGGGSVVRAGATDPRLPPARPR